MLRSRKSKLSTEELREKQEKYNASISSSLAGILRLSLDAQFRKTCFDMMKVDNTNDLEAALKKHLDILSHVRPTSPTINLEELELMSNQKDGSNEPECMVMSEVVLGGSEKDENNVQTEIHHNSNDLENNEFWPGVECFEWTSAYKSVTEISTLTKEDNVENEELCLGNECFQWETSKIDEPERNEELSPESQKNANDMPGGMEHNVNEELSSETQKNANDMLLLKDVMWE